MEKLNVIDEEDSKTDMMFEHCRVKTFNRWPYTKNEKCTPYMMAAAGWYSTSVKRSDISAKCAFCLKELNGWESTDDPWEEHDKHSAKCPFLMLKKKQEECTVAEMYYLLQERILAIMAKQFENDNKKLHEACEKVMKEIDKVAAEQGKI